jgi:site-specific DNA-methyltransferase (adenine-specific)
MIDLQFGDCLELLKEVPAGSVDLVVADPPYWKVVNEKWDYQWRTEQDYVDWAMKWLVEVERVLRYGGTFYCFGYFRMLALLVARFESLGFDLRQQIIVDKGMRSVSGRATKKYRIFPNTTESIVMSIKDNKGFIKPFLKERQAELKLTSRQINEMMGVKSNGGGMWSIYTGKNICEQFPTRKMWERLSRVLEFDMPYDKVAQTFNPQMGLTDVWGDIDFYAESRHHSTQKPLKLVERLVRASSNDEDLVLDPFMGGGTTGVACKNLGRRFIGMENVQEYFDVAKRRIEET